MRDDYFIGSDVADSAIFRGGLRKGLHFCFSSSSSNQASKQTTSSTAGANSPSTSGDTSPINAGDGLQVGANARVDLTDAPQITQSAFDTISQVVQNALNSLGNVADTSSYTVQQQAQANSDNTAANSQQLASLLTTVLAADQATAANTASGGQTNTNKTVLWVVGIVAVVIGALGLAKLFGKK